MRCFCVVVVVIAQVLIVCKTRVEVESLSLRAVSDSSCEINNMLVSIPFYYFVCKELHSDIVCVPLSLVIGKAAG